MRTIYKYPLHNNNCLVSMPASGKVIHFDCDLDHQLHVWVEVDTNEAHKERHFVVFGTGQDIPYGMDHVGTAMEHTSLGTHVWHLYERGAP